MYRNPTCSYCTLIGQWRPRDLSPLARWGRSLFHVTFPEIWSPAELSQSVEPQNFVEKGNNEAFHENEIAVTRSTKERDEQFDSGARVSYGTEARMSSVGYVTGTKLLPKTYHELRQREK